ncbi:hypothetical protein BKH42_00270 [Helicobacter sp. 13S00482-2]|uniref:cache domain-containing protein n=1 Tax=Helicobacter sp. 13S00482-2 TaxID=1476200 RepID=UPI000BD10C3F|nr:cache domain-containing protein [Helicobacter sp. 13S00482-2]PAF54389.1 hypothetical protein BKH42_00270 [Helicobacter sp. 13S00482-2]
MAIFSTDSSISTKTKTMVLVLGLFVFILGIFFYFRYQDIQTEDQKNQRIYKKQIQNIFNISLRDITSFFINRAFGNIDSYGITNALKTKNVALLKSLSLNRFEVLKNENPYLKDMIFYDSKLNRLVKMGDSNLRNKKIKFLDFKDKKPKYGFFINDNCVTYNVLVPIYESEFLGVLEFVFSIEFFSKKISEYGYGKGFTFILKEKIPQNSKIINKNYILQSNEKFTPSQQRFLKTAPLEENKKYIFDNHLFISHSFDLRSYDGKNIGKFVLYQDISSSYNKIKYTFYQTIFFAVITFILLFFILNYGFDVLFDRLEKSNRELKLKQEELKNFNANLETRVSEEIRRRMHKEEEVRLKEGILLHQSKMASMGEMIGNIAHQWRQPLSELGSILANIGLYQEMGKLDEKKLVQKISEGENLILHMSNTIDDFRNFFSADKQRSVYSVNQMCHNTLALIDSALKNHFIQLEIIAEREIFTDGYPQEFSQALLNILGNAKDVLLEKGVKKPKITLQIEAIEDKIKISIKDNGGGIKLSPIEKIFEPYISTKQGMNGTGIGLYMSKIIIEKNVNGKLIAYNDKSGAIFEIWLKLANHINETKQDQSLKNL